MQEQEETDILQVERQDAVALVTLNRPDSLNALNPALMRELVEAMQELAEDDAVRCLVLTGAGRGFCAGGDVRAISKAADDRVKAEPKAPPTAEEIEADTAKRTAWLRRSVEAARLLHEMGKPTIAMINGACAGAGLSLAGACDFRFSAASAKFRAAFTPQGMPGDYGGSWFWTRILGPAKSRQLYMLDEKRTAEQALAFGLIDRIYADEDLVREVMAIAHHLAGLPGKGLAFAKANLNAALDQDLASTLDLESRNMMLARNVLVALRRAAAK
jgi:2-(1,2-epoxy-1,2-dihydrophenyl)acetyl-CoA isomerase